MTGLRLVGVAIGFVGVALLVGAQPAGEGARGARRRRDGALLRHRRAARRPPPRARCSRLSSRSRRRGRGARDACRSGSRRRRDHVPGWKTIGVGASSLAIPLTAFAFLLFYAIIAGAGAAYASLVTYLVPPIALAYGAIFLDERFGAAAFGGLALILGGVALGTGGFALGAARRRAGLADVSGIERSPRASPTTPTSCSS